jgi:predicted dinucleotide-binding enzyme
MYDILPVGTSASPTADAVGPQRIARFSQDDPGSKETVRKLAEGIGFDAVDVGPKSARYLGHLACLT